MTSKNSLRSGRRDELLSATKNKIFGGTKRHEIGERPVLLAQGRRFQGNFLLNFNEFELNSDTFWTPTKTIKLLKPS